MKVFNIDELRVIGLTDEQIQVLIEKGMAVEEVKAGTDNRTTKQKISDFKWESQARIGRFFGKVKDDISKAADFAINNKEIVGMGIFASISAYKTYANYKTHKMVNRRYNDSLMRVYDPRNHCQWLLSRPLTNSEQMELRIRVQNGESYYDVLKSFGVLR